MTVEQLIERLQEFPPHHRVFVPAEVGDQQVEADRVEDTEYCTVTIS